MNPLKRHGPWIFVALATAVLAIRFYHFVALWAVNVLYWDQWDFLDGFFQEKDLVTLFRWQHGPHRQGLGALFLQVVYGATNWNIRVEAYVSATIILIATVAFLALKRRVAGRWDFTDAVIPLATLTTLQFEIFAGAQNPSHGPLPMLLVAATAATLLVKNAKVAAPLLVVLGLLSTYTGFAVFNGALIPALLGARLLFSWRTPERNLWGAAFVLSGGALASFLVGYEHRSAVECFHFPHDKPHEYLQYGAVMFGKALGISGEFGRPWRLEKQIPMFLAYAALFAVSGWAAWKTLKTRGQDRLSEVIFQLSAFTLAFGFFTAVGRICLGIDTARTSRYVPYEVPGIVALYLGATMGLRSPRRRRLAGGALLLLLAVKEAKSYKILTDAAHVRDGKVRWVTCYLAFQDIGRCDQDAQFRVHPGLDPAKLKYLEDHGLSFFHTKAP